MSLHPWEREYRRPTFVTNDERPQQSVKDFFRFLKKQGVPIEGTTLLDLGCGNGRNSLYAASLGASATGYDIAPTAIRHASALARHSGSNATFAVRSLADTLPLADASIDIVLDVTASHSVLPTERIQLYQEIARVTKPGSWLLLRTLTRDGDANAKQLVKQYGTNAPHTYRMPQTGMIEHVASKEELISLLSDFSISSIKKTIGYMTVNGNTYKRAYYLIYATRT